MQNVPSVKFNAYIREEEKDGKSFLYVNACYTTYLIN